MSRRFSRIPPPVWILFGFAALAVLVFATGCASTTASRVTVTTPERTIRIVLPKDTTADSLKLTVDPATGRVTLDARKIRATASDVIDSAGEATTGAIDGVSDVAGKIAPFIR